MIRSVLQIGDPILDSKSEEVTDINSGKIQTLITDLIDTCIELESRSAGISAPQVGENLRICICRRTDLENEIYAEKGENAEKLDPQILWEVLINPVIHSFSKEESYFWEGCLSIGVTEKDTLFGPVSRPDTIDVEYINRRGERIRQTAKDFYAHIIQHEVDHLEGILFISKVPNPQDNIWRSDKLDKHMEKTGDYPPILT